MNIIKTSYKICFYTINRNSTLIYVPKSKLYINVNNNFLIWKYMVELIIFYVVHMNIVSVKEVLITGRSNLLNKKIIATLNTIICMNFAK